MQSVSVKNVLEGDVEAGQKVIIQAWVRTRRDSKAGFSFIHVNDGSSFGNVQLVADKDLPNYQQDVLRLSSGASLRCVGTVVESKGRGQSLEIQAERIEALGLVDDPDTYPIQPKQHSFEFLRFSPNSIRSSSCAPLPTCDPAPTPLGP